MPQRPAFGERATGGGGTRAPRRTGDATLDAYNYFNSLFPGETLSHEMLVAKEKELGAYGIRLLPNAQGRVGKVDLPGGVGFDVVQGGESGLNRKQFLPTTPAARAFLQYGVGGGAGGGAGAGAPGRRGHGGILGRLLGRAGRAVGGAGGDWRDMIGLMDPSEMAGAAMAAGIRQRKRAGGSGRSSTILGGFGSIPFGLTATGAGGAAALAPSVVAARLYGR